MKMNNIPVSFKSRFDKYVYMLISCDNWGELSLSKVTIGHVTYRGKYLTPSRAQMLLQYASKFVDINAAITAHEYDIKNGKL